MPTFAWTEAQPLAIAEIISLKSVSTGPITRDGSTVSAKTGRLETLSRQREMQGEGGQIFMIDAFILAAFGAGFEQGDRFTIANQLFEVVMIAPGMTDNESVYLRLKG